MTPTVSPAFKLPPMTRSMRELDGDLLQPGGNRCAARAEQLCGIDHPGCQQLFAGDKAHG